MQNIQTSDFHYRRRLENHSEKIILHCERPTFSINVKHVGSTIAMAHFGPLAVKNDGFPEYLSADDAIKDATLLREKDCHIESIVVSKYHKAIVVTKQNYDHDEWHSIDGETTDFPPPPKERYWEIERNGNARQIENGAEC